MQLKKGGKIYVHCMCGISRSVSVVLAYMMSLSEEDVYILLEKIKEARPIANPNSEFISQLVSFRHNINYINAMKEMQNDPNSELYRPPAENPYFLEENMYNNNNNNDKNKYI